MEFVEIEPNPIPEPPELKNETSLLQALAPSADPQELRRLAGMKKEASLWIAAFIVLSPLLILGSSLLPQLGLPAWSAQVAVVLSLLLLFIFFGMILVRLLKGSKIFPVLGFEVLGQNENSLELGARALRHNRRVEWTPQEKFYTCRLWIAAPEFSVVHRRGKFFVSEGAPLAVRTLLAGLRPGRRWAGLEIKSGAEGMEARRPIQRSRDWIYDLWLLERMVETLG